MVTNVCARGIPLSRPKIEIQRGRDKGDRKRGGKGREREMEILETGNTGKTGGGRTVEETRVESVHGLPGAHHFHT